MIPATAAHPDAAAFSLRRLSLDPSSHDLTGRAGRSTGCPLPSLRSRVARSPYGDRPACPPCPWVTRSQEKPKQRRKL